MVLNCLNFSAAAAPDGLLLVDSDSASFRPVGTSLSLGPGYSYSIVSVVIGIAYLRTGAVEKLIG